MKSHTILLIFILIFLFAYAGSGQDNYCTNSQSWQEWDALSNKYPDDMDIQILHAFRLGLCAKVQRGDITVQQATDIFEKARNAIIDKKKLESLKGKGITL